MPAKAAKLLSILQYGTATEVEAAVGEVARFDIASISSELREAIRVSLERFTNMNRTKMTPASARVERALAALTEAWKRPVPAPTDLVA